jgi:hypothetical protein
MHRTYVEVTVNDELLELCVSLNTDGEIVVVEVRSDDGWEFLPDDLAEQIDFSDLADEARSYARAAAAGWP